ncbi:ABC-type transport auxiliary lipoprotein family protein [Parasalinivibrio latis]|uniref:PqiC family protein n=1 Tax=Parasalinivibrio latis TaxID=2952610 RepID=UPI0030E07C83
MKKTLSALLAVLALAGCSTTGSESTVNTFVLPTPATQGQVVTRNGQPLLIVQPVEMADYLAGTGLVYKVSDSEIVIAQQNLWGESIANQLTRRITRDLRADQKAYWPVELTPAMATQSLPSLQVKISAFNGDYNGNADVSGEWMVLDGNGELKYVREFSYQIPLDESGYQALVSALSKGVEQLTTSIAGTIAKTK